MRYDKSKTSWVAADIIKKAAPSKTAPDSNSDKTLAGRSEIASTIRNLRAVN